MGMIANYQQITNQELEKLESNEALFEIIEELQENENLEICDIDKMWDALHCLLTGKSASEPIENNEISEAIVGQFNISEQKIEEFISGTRANRVKDIAKALQEINIEPYLEKFSMKEFAKKEIYPCIWEHEEEADEILEELRECFENLKEFYQKMEEQNSAVLVSIY